MCQLFAHQPQRDYESQTRSLRIGGWWQDLLRERRRNTGRALLRTLRR